MVSDNENCVQKSTPRTDTKWFPTKKNCVQRSRSDTKWFLTTTTVCKELEQIENGF